MKYFRKFFEMVAVVLVAAIVIFFIHNILATFQSDPAGQVAIFDAVTYQKWALCLVVAMTVVAIGWLVFKYAEIRNDLKVEAALEKEEQEKRAARKAQLPPDSGREN